MSADSLNALTEKWKQHCISQKLDLRAKLIDACAKHEGWEESAVALVDEALMPVIRQHEADVLHACDEKDNDCNKLNAPNAEHVRQSEISVVDAIHNWQTEKHWLWDAKDSNELAAVIKPYLRTNEPVSNAVMEDATIRKDSVHGADHPTSSPQQPDDMPTFDIDKARKDLKPAAWELLRVPMVQSLLYDINLLPEQITTGKHWFYMLSVLSHMDSALKRV